MATALPPAPMAPAIAVAVASVESVDVAVTLRVPPAWSDAPLAIVDDVSPPTVASAWESPTPISPPAIPMLLAAAVLVELEVIERSPGVSRTAPPPTTAWTIGLTVAEASPPAPAPPREMATEVATVLVGWTMSVAVAWTWMLPPVTWALSSSASIVLSMVF